MLSKRRRNLLFLEAGILTVAVYIFALFFNLYLDELRVSSIEQELLESDIFFDQFSSGSYIYEQFLRNNCNVSKQFLLEREKELRTVGKSFRDYGGLFSKSNIIKKNILERKYVLDQLKLYEWLDYYNNNCVDINETIVPVIYFYDSSQTGFDRQSLLLEQYASNQENKTIIFTFDFSFDEEPVLDIIKKKYEIRSSPFLIIGNKTTRDLPNQNSVVTINTLTIEMMRLRGELS